MGHETFALELVGVTRPGSKRKDWSILGSSDLQLEEDDRVHDHDENEAEDTHLRKSDYTHLRVPARAPPPACLQVDSQLLASTAGRHPSNSFAS